MSATVNEAIEIEATMEWNTKTMCKVNDADQQDGIHLHEARFEGFDFRPISHKDVTSSPNNLMASPNLLQF